MQGCLSPKVSVRMRAPIFPSFEFFTVATAGPITWHSHHESINGDTHQRVFDYSTGNPVNFRP